MNFFIPEHEQSFIVEKPSHLKLTEGFSFRDEQKHYLAEAIHPDGINNGTRRKKYKKVVSWHDKDNKEVLLEIPHGTKIVVKGIEVKKRIGSWYRNHADAKNFINLELFHPKYKGVEYSTVPKLKLMVYQGDFKELGKLVLKETDTNE